MNEYHVTWEIDIEAENAVEAALFAREIQLDPESIANSFEVRNERTGHDEVIDLEYDLVGTKYEDYHL